METILSNYSAHINKKQMKILIKDRIIQFHIVAISITKAIKQKEYTRGK